MNDEEQPLTSWEEVVQAVQSLNEQQLRIALLSIYTGEAKNVLEAVEIAKEWDWAKLDDGA